MKKHLSVLALLLSGSLALYAQDNKRDSVPLLFDDYSNRKSVDASVISNDYFRTKESTVVIIDKKILTIDDKRFKELDKSKIKKMEIIKDEQSTTGIKNVIIITTK